MRDVLVYVDGCLGFVLNIRTNVLHVRLMTDSVSRHNRYEKARTKQAPIARV